MSDEAAPPGAPPEPASTTTPATPAAPAADPGRGPIPYERFQEVTADKRMWEKRAAELEAKLGGYATVEQDVQKLRADLEAAQAALTTQAATWAEERALLAVGFTDGEAQDAARFAWGRLAEDQRPKGGIGEWLTSIKADPSKAPKVLTPFLPSGQPPSPRPTDGASPIPASDVTAEAIRAATEHGKRTGDWTRFDALAKAVPRTPHR